MKLVTDIREIAAKDYHADPCEMPSLSSSMAHTILTRSPLHAYATHPRLGGAERVSRKDDEEDTDDTKAMHAGRVFHDMILGIGASVEFVPFDSFRTNAAKARRAEIEGAGGLAVLEKYANYYQKAVTTITARINDMGYEMRGGDGMSEVGVFWHEYGVQCRGLIDRLLPDGHIIDLKMCVDARAATMARKFIDYGYDIQGTAYPRGLVANRPELSGRARITFLFAEHAYPFDVVPVTFAGTMAEYGEKRWSRALGMWAKCMREGRWPGLPAQRVDCPEWAMAEEDGAE